MRIRWRCYFSRPVWCIHATSHSHTISSRSITFFPPWMDADPYKMSLVARWNLGSLLVLHNTIYSKVTLFNSDITYFHLSRLTLQDIHMLRYGKWDELCMTVLTGLLSSNMYLSFLNRKWCLVNTFEMQNGHLHVSFDICNS